MTRIVALPHLQTAAVEPGEWLVALRGETIRVPELLKGWDYATELRFECQVSINLPSVLEECGLASDAEVAITGTFLSSSTNPRGLGAAVPVSESGGVAMSFDVDPTIIGGRLTLQRQLVLMTPGSQALRFAAREPGAILWDEDRSSRTSVLLEGSAARFLDRGARLQRRPGRRTFGGLVVGPRLLGHGLLASGVVAALRQLETPSDRTSACSTGRCDDSDRFGGDGWDVGRSMINAALDTPDFIEGWGQFRPGSLGETLELLIRRVWPTHDGLGSAQYASPRCRAVRGPFAGSSRGPRSLEVSWVWPRLPAVTARQLLAELRGWTRLTLRSTSSITHLEAAPIAVGGRPVPVETIARVERSIRAVADELGFPNEIARANVATFDRPATRILFDEMEIVPADAASEEVWNFLTLVVLPDVAVGGSQAAVDERLLGRPWNAFRRLWWRRPDGRRGRDRYGLRPR